LGVRCPWCGAAAGQWCEKVITCRRGKQPVTLFVHPSRADAVGAKSAPFRPPWGPLDPDPQF
jgi:hypothetical protein